MDAVKNDRAKHELTTKSLSLTSKNVHLLSFILYHIRINQRRLGGIFFLFLKKP